MHNTLGGIKDFANRTPQLFEISVISIQQRARDIGEKFILILGTLLFSKATIEINQSSRRNMFGFKFV